MLKLKTEEDILQFAIGKEIEANRFYRALGERVKDPAIRELFESLAAEEVEHREKLELEMLKLGRAVKTDPDVAPIRNSDYVISDVDELDIDQRDALALGITKEDAAFVIYVNLFAQAKSDGMKELLLGLAQEEVKHKLRFEIEYDNLMKKR